MTPAEFRTMRETLGLTGQWVADRADVSLRAVQYWDEGRWVVPEAVEDMLETIEQTLEAAVEQALEQVDESIARGAVPDEITLIRYRTDKDLWRFRPDMQPLPATTHGVLVTRLKRALCTKGIAATIEFMKPDEYMQWLGEREDTETTRAEWASTRPSSSYPARRRRRTPADRKVLGPFS